MSCLTREYVFLKGRGNYTESFLVQSHSYLFRTYFYPGKDI